MEIEPATSQNNRSAVSEPLKPKRFVTWDDAIALIDGLPRDYTYFGIPRGGQIVAGLARARDYNVTDQALDATAFLDDIIDSGATKEKWTAQYGLPFFALYHKSHEWLVFPWDTENESGGEDVVRRALQLIGEDPNREGLRDTPARVVRSWRELFGGYSQDPATILARDFDKDGYDQMIVCKDIEFHSTCEHHMLPFYGTATVGYIPDQKIVGLSKLARLVDVYAHRLQIQERMTEQIAAALETYLQPRGSAVVIEAKHYCMVCRGVRKQQSGMITSALKGFFFDDVKARAEFMQLAHS